MLAYVPLAIISAIMRRSSSVMPGVAAGGYRTMDVAGSFFWQYAPNPHLGGVALPGYRRMAWTVNPSFPSTLTAPLFPPSKSPEPRRWPVANSYAVPKIAFGG
jgi:hypothetical protein